MKRPLFLLTLALSPLVSAQEVPRVDEAVTAPLTIERAVELAVTRNERSAIADTTVDASGGTRPIPGGHKLYRFAACPNYNPGSDDSYPDLRPRDSYRFVSKVLRPKQS